MSGRLNRLLLLSLLLLQLPLSVCAQWNFDVLSVESFIGDHKRVRTVLLIRAGVEQANEVLMKDCKETSETYESVNAQLDKYTKAFNVLDVVINGGIAAWNAKETYDDVSDRLKGISSLINKFVTQCTARGDIESADSLIIGTCVRAVDNIRDDLTGLINSLWQLATYATGAAHCSTYTLLLVIDQINNSMDALRSTVDNAYFTIWRYVTLRTTWWKAALYRSRPLKEMADDAFSRWRWATRQVGF